MNRVFLMFIFVLLLVVCVTQIICLREVFFLSHPKYQYTVVSIKDSEWGKIESQEWMLDGWQLFSCRRALEETSLETGEYDYLGKPVYERVGIYECIIQKRHSSKETFSDTY